MLNLVGSFVQIEYEVKKSSKAAGVRNQRLFESKRTTLSLPTAGYVIYGVAHQHTGGIGSALYGEVIFFAIIISRNYIDRDINL